jgi:hypothetical protein
MAVTPTPPASIPAPKDPPFLKGWRTVLYNIAVPVAAVALQQLNLVDFGKMGWPMIAAFFTHQAINIGLRAITNTPIGKA